MADLTRYRIVAGVIMCDTCTAGSKRKIVAVYKDTLNISVADVDTEIQVHEHLYHTPVFEDNATEVGLILRRVAKALKWRAEAAQRELTDNPFFKAYRPETAYADGMINGMSGATGDMAALLDPNATLILAQALHEASEMDGQCDVIQDHDRTDCDDFTCSVFGALVELARIIDKRLE